MAAPDNQSLADFGAVGDGVTDDSAALQAAFDHVSSSGGGILTSPHNRTYLTTKTLIPRSSVTLAIPSNNYGYQTNSVSIKGRGLSALFEATTDVTSFAINGIGLQSDGTTQDAIRLSGAYWCSFSNLNFFGFSGRMIRMDGGFNTRITHLLGTNCGNALPGSGGKCGLVEVGGSDHTLYDMEISYNNGPTAPKSYSPGMTVAGLYVKGSSNFFTGGIVAEFCETGIIVDGDHNKFTATRADNNWGTGWIINGTDNLLAACSSYENGKRTSNTYDGFQANGAGNSFVACTDYASTGKLKYGFHDTVNQSAAIRNRYAAWQSVGALTAPFSANSYLGSSPDQGGHIGHISSASAGVIDVTGLRHVHLDFDSTTITKITGGHAGKELLLFTGSSSIVLSDNNTADGFYFGSGNVTLTPNVGLRLFYDNGKWLRG